MYRVVYNILSFLRSVVGRTRFTSCKTEGEREEGGRTDVTNHLCHLQRGCSTTYPALAAFLERAASCAVYVHGMHEFTVLVYDSVGKVIHVPSFRHSGL